MDSIFYPQLHVEKRLTTNAALITYSTVLQTGTMVIAGSLTMNIVHLSLEACSLFGMFTALISSALKLGLHFSFTDKRGLWVDRVVTLLTPAIVYKAMLAAGFLITGQQLLALYALYFLADSAVCLALNLFHSTRNSLA